MKLLGFVLILVSFQSLAEQLPSLHIEDWRLEVCRSTPNKICADYSLKSWPIKMKGARYVLSTCLDEATLNTVSGLCDRLFKTGDETISIRSFYNTYPGCKIIWKAQQLWENNPNEYKSNYHEAGCFNPEDLQQ